MIAAHMQRLAKKLEITSSLAKDVPGIFFFPVDDDLDVTITQLGPGVLFDCEIAPLPKNKDLFYTRMLLANLFGQGTFGAELGITKDDKLILQYRLDYDPDFNEFDNKLEDFLNAADFWRDEARTAS